LTITALGLLLSLLPLPGLAEETLTVATWNVGFLDRGVEDLDLEGFLTEVDFDILLVNEVKTEADLEALKAAMGRESFFTTISSFENGSGNLEVGIISRYPLANIVEFDQTLDNDLTAVPERLLERVDLPGIEDVGVGRGFLVAEVPELELFVIVSHFKSSVGATGPADFRNAQKRELVAAAVATYTLKLLEENPEHTVIFGGDVNVGVTDSVKNGVSLIDDDTEGYDETHALLGGGLINGLMMRSLAQDVASTFVGDDNIPDFPGTGAIDVLYVSGGLAESFGVAEAASDRFGSDHLAVFASIGDDIAGGEGTVAITNALPNPEGSDFMREQITLTYEGEGLLDISGWFMRDAASNTYVFPAGTILTTGDNSFTLVEHTMPLNNSGDSITLFDQSGAMQGLVFTYNREDVVAGEPVR
jgi:exonuclease III